LRLRERGRRDAPGTDEAIDESACSDNIAWASSMMPWRHPAPEKEQPFATGVNTPWRFVGSEIIFGRMKMKPKLDLVFGGLIMLARGTRGAGRANRLTRLMIELRFTAFREPALCLIPISKERFV
jgi:hypothetical protein